MNCFSSSIAAVGQHDLLLNLLEDPDRRRQLRTFCTAYLGVEVTDALATEADRLGFTLLGKPAVGADDEGEQAKTQRWRQFRIGFQRELRNQEAFLRMLDDMWAEVEQASAHTQ
ncbi:hypothetical protein N2152v2_001096 [Parachlorella kessleri]